MNLLGHSGADLINTWGFAYVGGVIGLFSLSLLYVKAKVDVRSDPSGANTGARAVASLGPAVIVVGGVCGVSLGLGVAGLLDSAFESADVNDVVAELCDLRTFGPGEPAPGLHEEVLHVIDDSNLTAAETPHRSLHVMAASPETTPQEWTAAIDHLASVLTYSDPGPGPPCGRAEAVN